ncbi:MAG: ribonuclease III [Ilumatobacteraceae bacterium]|jgi:ribonuclease-3
MSGQGGARAASDADDARVDVAALARMLGHDFGDASLARTAMLHASWSAEHPGVASNERLEFLGDAVLGWVVADVMYRRHPDVEEGRLTDLRKNVVNAAALAEVAGALGLGAHVLLGRGESAAGGARKPSILANALEALFGAVYLDGGAAAAHACILRVLARPIDDAAATLARLDPKTQLQELAARLGLGAPEYRVEERGPDHAKEFRAVAVVGGEPRGTGTGRSKKAAEQEAARVACAALEGRGG